MTIALIDNLKHLPEDILFDLARNESAPIENRKAAVSIMLRYGFKKALRPEVSFLRNVIEKEQQAIDEVEAGVEAAVESPLSTVSETAGPYAGFTTSSMYQPSTVQVSQ